jgi:predicted enzyme related to lactoylglutathione lyase
MMVEIKRTFSSFSVTDTAKAKEFYSNLGVKVNVDGPGLRMELQNGGTVFVYPKPNHEPATFTILNFVVEDIDQAVDQLKSRGIAFERYEGMSQDEKGIMRAEGPPIAWFKDPSGNILSVIKA